MGGRVMVTWLRDAIGIGPMRLGLALVSDAAVRRLMRLVREEQGR